jgi:hypothetical protein
MWDKMRDIGGVQIARILTRKSRFRCNPVFLVINFPILAKLRELMRVLLGSKPVRRDNRYCGAT